MPPRWPFAVVMVLLWLAQSGTSQAPARCATTTTLSGSFTDIIVELGEVNCFTCSLVISWTANNDMGNPISVTSASPLVIGVTTVVEVEGNYLVLPSPGDYVLPGSGGRKNIICSDNSGNTYEARLSNPTLVAPTFNPVTVNEFTPLTIRCVNVAPNNVGRVQIFNPDGEMVGDLSYTVPNATREFGGTYSCVATSRIDPNVTATTTAEVIIQHAPDITPANISSNEISWSAELRLTCGYVGVPAPDFKWIHNNSIALNSTSPRVSVLGGQPGDSTSSIVIDAVDRDSSGTYTCRANNSLGTAEVVYTVHILRSPVNFLTVTVLNASTAFVQWEHQDAAESYEIEVQAIDAPDIPSKEIVLCGNSRNRIINNLAAGKRYRFTITPIYENDTPGTDVSTVQTIVESSPSGPPRNVRVIFSVTTFYVLWEEPSFAEQGGVILSYDIFYRTAPIASTFTAVSNIFNTALYNSSSAIQVYQLDIEESSARQVYEVKIRAVNRVGSGPNSTLVAATFSPDTLVSTTTLTVITATSGGLLATWVVVSIVIIALLMKSRSRARREMQMVSLEQPAAMLTRKDIDTSQNIAYVSTKINRSTTQDAGDSNAIYTVINTKM